MPSSGVARNFKREDSINYENHQKSLTYFGHLAIFCSFFTKMHNQKRVGGHGQWRRQKFSLGKGGETLGRILTLMLSLMTRLSKAEIHTFVSKERKLYHYYNMSPIPRKLIANYSIRGLAVPRAGTRSFVTGKPIVFDIYSGAPRIW